MAVVGIIEFSDMPIVPGSAGNPVPVGAFNANAVYQTAVTISTTATSSAAFGAKTCFIRVSAVAAINFAIGPSATTTATTGSSAIMAAGTAEYFGVAPGQVFSLISSS